MISSWPESINHPILGLLFIFLFFCSKRVSSFFFVLSWGYSYCFDKECPSLHFLTDFINSTFSPTITYSNLFFFTIAFLYFLIYIFNVTFSTTLRSFNIFLFNTFPFDSSFFFSKSLCLLFLRIPTSSSSLLLASLHEPVFAFKFDLSHFFLDWYF